MAEEKPASKVAIIVAAITVFGSVIVAVVNKWDFSPKPITDSPIITDSSRQPPSEKALAYNCSPEDFIISPTSDYLNNNNSSEFKTTLVSVAILNNPINIITFKGDIVAISYGKQVQNFIESHGYNKDIEFSIYEYGPPIVSNEQTQLYFWIKCSQNKVLIRISSNGKALEY